MALSGKNFSLSHVYANNGTYTVTVAITDNQSATGTATATITVYKALTALSPAQVWISKNVLDAGLKLDILAEVYKDTTLVSSGQLNSVTVGSGGFNNATLVSTPFTSFSPVSFPSGTDMKIDLYARNACTGSLRNAGTAKLWFNDSAANSHFDATLGGSNSNYYLLNNSILSTAAGTGPQQSSNVAAGAKCSPFKSFGTWTKTITY